MKAVKSKCGSNQWNSTCQVIEWFNKLEQKSKLTFFKFDIVSYYPSINEKLFQETIKWAECFHNFTSQEKEILKHSRKSFLFLNREPWVKKNNSDFDVTMGSYDGAETADMVGLYVLSKLEKLIDQKHLGLYRDDGLAVVNLTGVKVEKLRKQVFKLFKSLDLNVTIESNITETDFLDLYLNLKDSTYRPYRKDNNSILYIDANSNHPQILKKQLPNMISNRISILSCSKREFDSESHVYNAALREAGYTDEIKFKMLPQQQNIKKRSRTRKVIWFNPPYSDSVKTDIGAKFLSLINEHFGNSELKQFFNRSTVKLSYSCMPNMDSIISNHDRYLLNTQYGIPNNSRNQPSIPNSTLSTPLNQSIPTAPIQALPEHFEQNNAMPKKECNCRGKNICPLNGKCLIKSIVYRAEITSDQDTVAYIGLASNTFKERYLNHISSFRNQRYKESTALSKYIWKLKDQNKSYEIKWFIDMYAPSYHPTKKRCNLCNTEKKPYHLHIIIF